MFRWPFWRLLSTHWNLKTVWNVEKLCFRIFLHSSCHEHFFSIFVGFIKLVTLGCFIKMRHSFKVNQSLSLESLKILGNQNPHIMISVVVCHRFDKPNVSKVSDFMMFSVFKITLFISASRLILLVFTWDITEMDEIHIVVQAKNYFINQIEFI